MDADQYSGDHAALLGYLEVVEAAQTLANQANIDALAAYQDAMQTNTSPLTTALSALGPLKTDTQSEIDKIDMIITVFQTARTALASTRGKQDEAQTLGDGAYAEVMKAY